MIRQLRNMNNHFQYLDMYKLNNFYNNLKFNILF